MTLLRPVVFLGFLVVACGGSETARGTTPAVDPGEASPPKVDDAGAMPPPNTSVPRDRSQEKTLVRATTAQFSEVICKIAKLNKVQTTAEECSRYKSENGSLGTKTFRRFAERLHLKTDLLTIERGDIDNDGAEDWILTDKGTREGSGLDYEALVGAYREKGAALEALVPPQNDLLGSWFFNGNFSRVAVALASEGTVINIAPGGTSQPGMHTFLWKGGRVTQLE